MKIIRGVIPGLLLLSSLQSFPQVNIIPKPAEVHVTPGGETFTITPETKILALNKELKNTADFLNDYLNEIYGFQLKTIEKTKSSNVIILDATRSKSNISGGYQLQVNKSGVTINGNDAAGTFYGVQTLLQLLPLKKMKSLAIPFVEIKDAPRFEYRGLMLDVSRHFFPVSFIKKYIDYLALHKMNMFHWHLTDDQGCRIEIKKYPELNRVSSYRNGTIIGNYPGTGNDGVRYGGFYTKDEIKEVVMYAAQRYVTVIPEIEMPGHGVAVLAAYPSLGCTGGPYKVQETWGVHNDVFCAGNDEVFTFLQDVIDEIIPLFPAKYIHIGGDECPKDRWKVCEKCQKRIKENNLKDEHELQSYFIQRMEKYINDKGKTIIGWDEILEGGLAPNALVMSWRGEKGGIEAAKQKHMVIMTPNSHVYFDHGQIKKEDSIVIGGYLPLEKVYSYEPVPKELSPDEAKYVYGAQGNVWTEYMANTNKVEYMLFPRLSALSEVLWSEKEQRNWEDFQKRLLPQFRRYDLWKVNYSKSWLNESKVK